MYIQPQTNIKLLRNVPLDPTFDHTIWFGDATSQYNYFAGKQAFNLTDYTYQRVNKGIARVGIKAVLIKHFQKTNMLLIVQNLYTLMIIKVLLIN
jgi:hypothetical protein